MSTQGGGEEAGDHTGMSESGPPRGAKEAAPGFEPGNSCLEMQSGFLTPTAIRFVLALAVLILLGITGRLDADSALVLWKVFLP